MRNVELERGVTRRNCIVKVTVPTGVVIYNSDPTQSVKIPRFR